MNDNSGIISNRKTGKRIYYLAATAITIFIEVLIACYVHDDFVRPYVGDVVVVFAVYTVVRLFEPNRHPGDDSRPSLLATRKTISCQGSLFCLLCFCCQKQKIPTNELLKFGDSHSSMGSQQVD